MRESNEQLFRKEEIYTRNASVQDTTDILYSATEPLEQGYSSRNSGRDVEFNERKRRWNLIPPERVDGLMERIRQISQLMQ